MPSYTQFLTEKSKKDVKLQASLKALNAKNDPTLPSVSSEEFTRKVYLREQDFNRLFNKGYIHWAGGKMLYWEPEQKKFLNIL